MVRTGVLLFLGLGLTFLVPACGEAGEGNGGVEIPAPGPGGEPDDDPEPDPQGLSEPSGPPASMYSQATRGQVDALIARLKSGDERDADMALMSLPAHPNHFVAHPELIPVVLDALAAAGENENGSDTMRGMAVSKVFDFGEKAAPVLPQLTKLLEDPKVSVHAALGMHKLGEAGEPAIDRMIQLLTHESPLVQAHCAEGLGNFGAAAARAAPALASILGGDSRNVVKLKAAHALGKIGPAAAAAVPALKAAAESGPGNLKYACNGALKKIEGE